MGWRDNKILEKLKETHTPIVCSDKYARLTLSQLGIKNITSTSSNDEIRRAKNTVDKVSFRESQRKKKEGKMQGIVKEQFENITKLDTNLCWFKSIYYSKFAMMLIEELEDQDKIEMMKLLNLYKDLYTWDVINMMPNAIIHFADLNLNNQELSDVQRKFFTDMKGYDVKLPLPKTWEDGLENISRLRQFENEVGGIMIPRFLSLDKPDISPQEAMKKAQEIYNDKVILPQKKDDLCDVFSICGKEIIIDRDMHNHNQIVERATFRDLLRRYKERAITPPKMSDYLVGVPECEQHNQDPLTIS
ncbi:MAG: hypothetical protein FWE31_02375 [Firmicutes bacterium]|nr:hypothetical protein [Bacillota bacterium]